MACIDVTQVIDLEIAADQTIEIVLSLIGGILIAIIIIALILIVRCRRVIIRMVSTNSGRANIVPNSLIIKLWLVTIIILYTSLLHQIWGEGEGVIIFLAFIQCQGSKH